MSKEIFLLDTNSFITPHLNFYPFDFAPGFWDQMEQHINSGRIAILDMVKNEILQGNDNLRSWMEDLEITCFVDRRVPNIVSLYGSILQHIQSNNCYKEAALKEWATNTVADPWLIAAAAANGFTLITFEEANKGLNPKTPSENAKIPDVASVFGVETKNLFYMMRELKFSLR